MDGERGKQPGVVGKSGVVWIKCGVLFAVDVAGESGRVSGDAAIRRDVLGSGFYKGFGEMLFK